MKKFVLKWGKGSVCEIRIIYKTLTTEAENIDNINWTNKQSRSSLEMKENTLY